MVKNEADIIEPFVLHNLRFLDAMFVVDNASVDATRQILLDLQREGLPLAILDDPESSFAQGEKTTRLLRTVTSTVFPEFVVPLDADEFLNCSSRDGFDSELQRIPSGGIGRIPWVTYVLTPGDVRSGVEDPPRSMEYRRKTEVPQYRKAILRTSGKYVPHYEFKKGNHEVVRSDGVVVESSDLHGVTLSHYPVRSAAQLEAKSVVGWIAHLKSDSKARDKKEAYQWRQAFDELVKEGSISDERLAESSFAYAQHRTEVDWSLDVVKDPPDYRYRRRSETRGQTSALSLVARSWEASLTEGWSFGSAFLDRVEQRRSRIDEVEEDETSTSFGEDWHLDRPFVDVPPFRFVSEKHQPTSVLDVGCGLGAYLLIFEALADSEIVGIEGFERWGTILEESEFVHSDITAGFDLGRKFDLVVCTEVLEHIEAQYEDVILDSLAAHAGDLILFSAGDENQPGHGHINCRPIGHWLSAWADRGWEPIEFDTLAFRSLATYSWLKRNPVLLRRSPSAVGDDASGLIERIGLRQFEWFGQDAEIIDYPLTQDPPGNMYEPGFVDRLADE